MFCDNCKYYDRDHRVCRNIKVRYVGCEECNKANPKQTNSDRIRAMTDEELAEWINQVQDGDAYQKENYLPPLSKSWWLNWLKREAIT